MRAALLSLLVALVFGTPTAAQAEAAGRLPGAVAPIHYELTLAPDIEAGTFHGTVVIDLDVRAATDRLVLNARDLTIGRVELPGEPDAAPHAAVDREAQTVTIALAHPLGVGRHRLALDYDGAIQRDQPYGLFTASYETPQGKRRILATQHEPADARRLVPCWDEPGFKASFTLSAIVPAAVTAVSNMPVARTEDLGTTKRVVFAETPRMSSYLLALVAGDLETITQEVDGVRVGVVTTAGNVEKGRFALGAAVELLRYYNDYFGIAYPLPKLDLIALPGGGGFGAMENWGAITFFERLLLFDPRYASEARRQDIYVVIAHEMAHQWFGDLVTMAWWDDLWLNEGFASWMQNRATDHFHPEWQVRLQARLAADYAMRIDARRTSHPIVQRIDTVNQAALAFDGITYSKGQAVITMIEAFLGETGFRDGVRAYLRAHAFGNATTAALWDALGEQSGLPVARIARSFTEQSGVPLVTVGQRCRGGVAEIDLRQSRFAIHDPAAEPLAWTVPVTLARPGRDEPPVKLLLDGTARFALGSCGPLDVNAGAVGYFRSVYAPPLAAVLSGGIATLTPADRLTLVSDGWALVQAGRMPVAAYLETIRRLGDMPERAVWEQALGSLRAIDALERGMPQRAAFQRAARALLTPLFQRLGWEARAGETAAEAALRESLLLILGDFDDPAVVAAARERFRAYVSGDGELPAGIREPVLHIAGRYADAESFEQLHRLARQATDQVMRQQYYRALGNALDPRLAARVLALALTDELPGALGSFEISRVAYAGEQAQLAWDFAQAHLAALTGKLDPMRRYRFVPQLMGAFDDAPRAAELRAFAAANIPADARREAERVAEDIEFKAEIKGWLLPAVDRWAALHPAAQ